MKSLINKATSTLSGIVLFAFGCVMAGLGLAAISMLALFALATMGIAVLAAPFLAMTQTDASVTDEVADAPDATATA